MRQRDMVLTPADRLPEPDLSHIPGPRGWPVIGQTLSFARDPYGATAALQAAYGDVFRISVFGQDWVVLTGPDALAEVLLNTQNIYSAKEGLRTFRPLFSGGLLHRDAQDHRTHRRVMQSAFRADALKSYLGLMNAEVAAQLDNLTVDQRFQIAPAMQNLTLRLGAKVLMGVTEEPEIARINAAFLKEVAATSAVIRSPWPLTKMGRGVAARAALARDFHAIIAARRAANYDDFFSQMCRASDEDGTIWTDEEIIDHFNFLLLAAHDPQTVTLNVMISFLAQDRFLQEGVLSEINRLPDGPLRYEDLDKLPLLERVYKEALRLIPPSAFTARSLLADTTWAGHHLPRGTTVVVCPGPVMRDPTLWPDPDRFDPDRFGPDRAEDQSHRFAWSPFGGGAHKCIGLHFSSIQVKAVMVQLLRRFVVHMDVADRPQWRPIPTPAPTNGLPVTLQLREPAPKPPLTGHN